MLVGLHGNVRGTTESGGQVSKLTERMEASRTDRLFCLAQLNKNTIEMRLLAADAYDAGLSVPKIAESLGVTHRTVYLWLKG
jgi:hypothetical protein